MGKIVTEQLEAKTDDILATAIMGDSLSGIGVEGRSLHEAVVGTVTKREAPRAIGIVGASTGFQTYGVGGWSESSGVVGLSDPDGSKFRTKPFKSGGVSGFSPKGDGVVGESWTGSGVFGGSTDGIGVVAASTNGVGLRAVSLENTAIFALTHHGIGVHAHARTGAAAVLGDATSGGVGGYFQSVTYPSVFTSSSRYDRPFPSFGMAGVFFGNVHITGTLTKSGGGFKIDHPLDPANKYLVHSFVESPEMKTMVDGTATLGAGGRVVVKLPNWHGALNKDARYQLTALGRAEPNLHVIPGKKGGSFTIAGGHPGTRVCWQVSGVRNDEWAKANRIVPEVRKTGRERGRYLHPEVYGVNHPSISHREPRINAGSETAEATSARGRKKTKRAPKATPGAKKPKTSPRR